MNGLIVIAVLGALVLTMIVAVIALWRTPQDWEPRTLRNARQPGPIERFWDEVAAGALREDQPGDDEESGSSE